MAQLAGAAFGAANALRQQQQDTISLQDILMQRALQERQMLMQQARDAEQRRQFDDQIGQRRTEFGVERQDAANRNELERYSSIAENLPPGVDLDEGTVSGMKKVGLESLMTRLPGAVTQGQQIDEQDGVPIYQTSSGPERYQSRGGRQYLIEAERAKQREEDRAARAELAAQTSADRAQAAAEQRAWQEGQNALTRGAVAGTRQTQDELTRLRIDGERTKQDEAKRVRGLASDAALNAVGDARDLLSKLGTRSEDGTFVLNDATKNLFGARIPGARYIPGSKTADADSALNRLKGRAVLDLISEMKSQSRTGATGFGAMNREELMLLENSATRLSSGLISDASAAEELHRIADIVDRTYNNVMSARGASVGRTRYDIDGNPIP